MIEVEVRLFGAFRKYEKGSPLVHLTVPVGTSVKSLKARLVSELQVRFPEFSEEALVQVSALADERQVLDPGTLLSKSCSLAILPPVCGG